MRVALNSNFFQKTADGLNGTPVSLLLGMRPMEGGPNAIQGKTNPRSAALVAFGPQRHQQRFHIRPG